MWLAFWKVHKIFVSLSCLLIASAFYDSDMQANVAAICLICHILSDLSMHILQFTVLPDVYNWNA